MQNINTETIIFILIIIIIFITAVFIIYYYPKNSSNNKILIGGNNDFFYPKYYPQVKVLDNQILNKLDKNDYVWLEKTDGERKILITKNNKTYVFKHGELIENDINFNFKNFTILDTEYYDNKYFIFDSPYIEGRKIFDNDFIQRLTYLQNNHTIQKSDKLKVKEYNKIKSFNEIIDFVNNNYKTENGIIDGIIIQNIYDNYFKARIYKLKTRTMNTTDFLLKKSIIDNKIIYNLYLFGDDKIYKSLIQKRPFETQIFQENNKKEILFSSPLYNNTYFYDPSVKFNIIENYKYFPNQIKEIKSFNEKDLDNKIIEMTWNGKNFFPIRIRKDKQFPNSYMVGKTNMETIFSPITNVKYFHDNTNAFSQDIIEIFHLSNRIMRKFIMENINFGFINNSTNSVLDLAGGRGGDIQSLIYSKFNNFFAVDSDSSALITYMNKLQNINYRNEYEPVINIGTNTSNNNLRNKNNITNSFEYNITNKNNSEKYNDIENNIEYKNIEKYNSNEVFGNAICFELNVDNKQLIDEIKSRYEFPKKFELILMNYAIHYLCDDVEKIKSLNNLVKELLNDNGYFIFTFFDGDSIIKDMKNNILKLKTFTIEKNGNKFKMPLPTIDKSGYREEPIVTNKILENINFSNYKEYNLFDETTKNTNISNLKNINLISDYLKYIRVRIYNKTF